MGMKSFEEILEQRRAEREIRHAQGDYRGDLEIVIDNVAKKAAAFVKGVKEDHKKRIDGGYLF
jgi:hypothetical protein